jgi:NAD(P)H-dependent flavin oxidoreductase YrpB (nitropropane dioxygenase family)
VEPIIVQGGMGVGASSWQLARAVANLGQLGVVSGTAVAVTVARRLSDGDPGGHVRRALDAFPVPDIAARVRDRYLREQPRSTGARFPGVARPVLEPARKDLELLVVANFVEVTLAKQGTDGQVGVNYLEKIQLPTLPSLYGAVLAGADAVLMGAGIPAHIPAILDRLARHEDVELRIDVAGGDKAISRFSPAAFLDGHPAPPASRPRFFAIVSSHTLATYLDRNSSGSPDGYVVELPVAGGHNAPPRGRPELDETGQPVYGSRDTVKLEAIAALGKPFWLAGGYGTPQRVEQALAAGAAGVQVGTAFAFCEESGLTTELKQAVLARVVDGSMSVRTDPVASPTGFPFKLVELGGTIADVGVAEARPRKCDVGYLREAYERDDGTLGYRCSAEPIADFVAKGGTEEDAAGRRCLCNGLLTAIDLGQIRRGGYAEPPVLTAGDDLVDLKRLLNGSTSYTAADVVAHLLERVDPARAGSLG